MYLYFIIITYLCLVFSYIGYRTESYIFALLFLIIAGLNLIALTIVYLDGGDYNIFR